MCEKLYEGVSPAQDIPATAARLVGNYPNPFNPSTTINFEIPESQKVVIGIFDVAGRKVATLVDGRREAGSHQVVWNGRDQSGAQVASGVFFVRMNTEGATSFHKITMVQ